MTGGDRVDMIDGVDGVSAGQPAGRPVFDGQQPPAQVCGQCRHWGANAAGTYVTVGICQYFGTRLQTDRATKCLYFARRTEVGT